MKKILSVLCVVLCAALCRADEPGSFQVLTNSQVIACSRGIGSAVSWATNLVVRQGMQIKSGPAYYWAVIAPTNVSGTNAPSTMSGDVSDGNITWRSFNNGRRNGVIVVNDGTNVVYVAFGNRAILNNGIRLNASGGSVSVANYQGILSAICGVNSNRVTIQEW